ncbi:MAG TPA: putative peptidoglycan glycosyltransferase FtsW [Candidatus Paceibacterota bacterium]|nr:putative peptidoglycan glycosyltransferase FtsW [Candidatus Paceibacterota bacterium]
MAARPRHIDRTLALLLALLLLGGCLIFASAAFGLLARGVSGIPSAVFNHLVLGVGAGIVALIVTATVDYRLWQRYAPYIFGFGIFLTLLVFVPHIGFEYGGGRRWIILAHISLQPSEFLKVATIIFASAYCAGMKQKVATIKYGLGGLCAILALPALILIIQPDIGTLGVIFISILAIFWVAGARWWHLITLMCAGALLVLALAAVQPYVRARVETFLHPSEGQQSQGYQIKQSLIAIGSGGIFGRGLGQGIQKFTFLPEPMGDSIFAVAGEELGFIGTITIILLFLSFAARGLNVAATAPDIFGTLLSVGITTYLSCEAFINIAAMLGLAPLTGIPLTFVSQGGSAMLGALASAGILLNVSRQRTKKT